MINWYDAWRSVSLWMAAKLKFDLVHWEWDRKYALARALEHIAASKSLIDHKHSTIKKKIRSNAPPSISQAKQVFLRRISAGFFSFKSCLSKSGPCVRSAIYHLCVSYDLSVLTLFFFLLRSLCLQFSSIQSLLFIYSFLLHLLAVQVFFILFFVRISWLNGNRARALFNTEFGH